MKGIMKKIFSLVFVALLAIVVGIAIRPYHVDAATTYVSDTFTRNATDSWGSTNPPKRTKKIRSL